MAWLFYFVLYDALVILKFLYVISYFHCPFVISLDYLVLVLSIWRWIRHYWVRYTTDNIDILLYPKKWNIFFIISSHEIYFKVQTINWHRHICVDCPQWDYNNIVVENINTLRYYTTNMVVNNMFSRYYHTYIVKRIHTYFVKAFNYLKVWYKYFIKL